MAVPLRYPLVEVDLPVAASSQRRVPPSMSCIYQWTSESSLQIHRDWWVRQQTRRLLVRPRRRSLGSRLVLTDNVHGSARGEPNRCRNRPFD